MKAILSGLVAVVVISVGAWLVLNAIGFSSADVYTSPNVDLRGS